MTYEKRATLAKSEMAKQLFKVMATKKSNLCVAADLTKAEDILNLVESVGPYICVLKTHVDIIEDFSENFIKSLKAQAKKHNFLIMEDRKFADIGNTVSLQYANGIYKISSWADFVTVHSLPGQSIVQGLKAVLPDFNIRGVFLLAELSSQGNLINSQYTTATTKMATEGNDCDLISGIVCQNPDVVTMPGLIQLTPGVKIEEGGDELGQQYNTPEYVVTEKGADVCVVGRGIIKAKNVQEAAKLYRDRLWQAYCKRVGIE
jgi:uridine monophosphate synthetase